MAALSCAIAGCAKVQTRTAAAQQITSLAITPSLFARPGMMAAGDLFNNSANRAYRSTGSLSSSQHETLLHGPSNCRARAALTLNPVHKGIVQAELVLEWFS